MEHEESYLRCTACETVSDHVVVYAGRLATQVRCENCGAVTTLDVFDQYLPDLRHRISTKPSRLLRRLRMNPVELIRSLPQHAATKPLKLASEVRAAWQSRRHG